MNTIKEAKRQPTEWKKIFANHNSDKGLTFRKHKEVQLSNKKTVQLEVVPGLGKSPGKGNGNPLQYFCLKNSMDREAWWATVHRVTESRTQLSNFTFFHFGLSPSISSSCQYYQGPSAQLLQKKMKIFGTCSSLLLICTFHYILYYAVEEKKIFPNLHRIPDWVLKLH